MEDQYFPRHAAGDEFDRSHVRLTARDHHGSKRAER
jgi:hypothetical protein